MIRRATDASFLNSVLNDPSVRPYTFARDNEFVDITAVIQDPNHLVLEGEHGGMILTQTVRGFYELHTQALPAGRGKWALDMAHACIDYLFSRTNATEVFTRVPQGNVAAAALTRACGAKLEQTIIQNLNGKEVQVDLYSGRIQDWIKIAPVLELRGEEFHRIVVQQSEQLGNAIPNMPDDPWFHRHLGVAVGMILGGQPVKGLLFYNRWATMALAPVIGIISTEPLIFDLGECRVEIQGDNFEVMPSMGKVICQPQ